MFLAIMVLLSALVPFIIIFGIMVVEFIEPSLAIVVMLPILVSFAIFMGIIVDEFIGLAVVIIFALPAIVDDISGIIVVWLLIVIGRMAIIPGLIVVVFGATSSVGFRPLFRPKH